MPSFPPLRNRGDTHSGTIVPVSAAKVRQRATQMSEAQFTAAVIELAHTFHWMVAHFRPARTASGWRTAVQGDAGFPDIVCARKGRVIFAELKARNGKLRAEQRAWCDALQSSARVERISGSGPFTVTMTPSQEWYLWRPDDLPEIAEILR